MSAAVQTCTLPAPKARNSAASLQVVTPNSGISLFCVSGSLAIWETKFKAIGLTAGHNILVSSFTIYTWLRAKVSKLTETIDATVLIKLTASAPPLAALAGYLISVMLG